MATMRSPRGATALARGELAAVETYKQALERIPAERGAGRLRELEAEHEEAARLLRERVASALAPPRSSGLWGAFARLVEGAAKTFGVSEAIEALKQGELLGIRDYENALQDPTLDRDTKQLIRTRLLPATRAHVPALDEILRDNARP